jgi:hypothetical protein
MANARAGTTLPTRLAENAQAKHEATRQRLADSYVFGLPLGA